MEIDETINKWFKQTKQNITGGKTYYKQLELDVDKLCGEVVVLLENYVQCVLLLLNKGKILPAKALLRIIGDVSIKCEWCLEGLKTSEEEFNKRFDKWWRGSWFEHRILMEKELAILEEEYVDEVSEMKEKLNNWITAIKTAGITKKDRFSITDKLVQDLWKTQPKLNLMTLYRRFHGAVHPDLILFEKILKESDGRIIYKGDVEEQPKRIKGFCLVILGYLFEVMYSVNKWDFSGFEEDIKQLREYMKEI